MNDKRFGAVARREQQKIPAAVSDGVSNEDTAPKTRQACSLSRGPISIPIRHSREPDTGIAAAQSSRGLPLRAHAPWQPRHISVKPRVLQGTEAATPSHSYGRAGGHRWTSECGLGRFVALWPHGEVPGYNLAGPAVDMETPSPLNSAASWA